MTSIEPGAGWFSMGAGRILPGDDMSVQDGAGVQVGADVGGPVVDDTDIFWSDVDDGGDLSLDLGDHVIAFGGLGVDQLGVDQLGVDQLGVDQLGVDQFGADQFAAGQFGADQGGGFEAVHAGGDETALFFADDGDLALDVDGSYGI